VRGFRRWREVLATVLVAAVLGVLLDRATRRSPPMEQRVELRSQAGPRT
jgi:F0F1-type ATP synthase assembly protein I